MKINQFLLSGVILPVLFLLSLSLAKMALACAPGDRAQVYWKGSWWPAQVVKAKGSKCYVHYDGYDKSWDEWVGPARIRITGPAVPSTSTALAPVPAVPITGTYAVGEPVLVFWKESWWPAQVIEVGNNRWRIHYDNYDTSWDEWVGPDRIRKK